MRFILVQIILSLILGVFGHAPLCGAENPRGMEVTVVGSVVENTEKAIEGIDYVREKSGMRTLDAHALLYDPVRGQYNLVRRFVVVKEARDEKGGLLGELEGRQLKLVGKKSSEIERYGGKEISVSGTLLCDKSLDVLSVSEVKSPEAEGWVCTTFNIDYSQCTYKTDTRTLHASHGRGVLELIFTAAGQKDCPPPSIAGSSGWAKATLGEWKNNGGTVSIDLAANESVLARSTRFDVGGSLLIAQAGAPCVVSEIEKEPATFSAMGGKGVLRISAVPSDCRWAPLPLAPWISVPPEMHCGDAAVSFVVRENSSFLPRTGAIRIVPASDGAKEAMVQITQEP